jgi:hypothetical protein
VPLSDEEERVLAEIEAQLASDHVADRMRDRKLVREPSYLVPALVALVCAGVTVVGFTLHVVVGLLGFAGLVGALIPLVRNALSSHIDDSDHVRYY